MGRELKYIENSTVRNMTFSRRQATIFNMAHTLATLCNIDVAVLINSPGELPYTYGSPCFDDVVEHIRNTGAVSSARQTRILEDQAKLDRLTKELERSKEHEKVLKKRKETTLQNYNMKDIIDLKLEDLVTFKEKLEALRDNLKRKKIETEASSSSLMLSKNKKKKKKIMETEFSSEQSFLLNRKIYDLRPRTPRNYLE